MISPSTKASHAASSVTYFLIMHEARFLHSCSQRGYCSFSGVRSPQCCFARARTMGRSTAASNSKRASRILAWDTSAALTAMAVAQIGPREWAFQIHSRIPTSTSSKVPGLPSAAALCHLVLKAPPKHCQFQKPVAPCWGLPAMPPWTHEWSYRTTTRVNYAAPPCSLCVSFC